MARKKTGSQRWPPNVGVNNGNVRYRRQIPRVLASIAGKKAYLVSPTHKLKKHVQLKFAFANQVDCRWLNGYMAAGFHNRLISLFELKLEHIKAPHDAHGERMKEAQERQLERRLTELCFKN